MGKFEVGQQVVAHGVVVRIADAQPRMLVKWGESGHCEWMYANALVRAPAPVTVRCDKCGFEHPLTDFPTLRERRKVLGIGEWGSASLHDFMELCAELAKKGVTPQQFVEGLT